MEKRDTRLYLEPPRLLNSIVSSSSLKLLQLLSPHRFNHLIRNLPTGFRAPATLPLLLLLLISQAIFSTHTTLSRHITPPHSIPENDSHLRPRFLTPLRLQPMEFLLLLALRILPLLDFYLSFLKWETRPRRPGRQSYSQSSNRNPRPVRERCRWGARRTIIMVSHPPAQRTSWVRYPLSRLSRKG